VAGRLFRFQEGSGFEGRVRRGTRLRLGRGLDDAFAGGCEGANGVAESHSKRTHAFDPKRRRRGLGRNTEFANKGGKLARARGPGLQLDGATASVYEKPVCNPYGMQDDQSELSARARRGAARPRKSASRKASSYGFTTRDGGIELLMAKGGAPMLRGCAD